MASPVDNTAQVRTLLLDLAGERSGTELLRLIVTRLAALPGVALCRLWLVEPGDDCEGCAMRAVCPTEVPCLHLVASEGHSMVTDHSWSHTEGRFRRFPLGQRKIGQVAATGEAFVVWKVEGDEPWIADPTWMEAEGIGSMTAQPLIFHGEVIGVFALFARRCVDLGDVIWYRMIADHAAAAICHARAFAEVERLSKELERENARLRDEVAKVSSFGALVGRSEALRRTVEQIDMVAGTDVSVLVTGESGTGKELVAREIHCRSSRREGPMVKVNCAAVPRELYESEFFGHVAGAFSGALRDRVGRFEAADGGTLFLDEVGEIPLDLQAKLLRVLQEGTFERIGEVGARRVDVRIVAATNRDLRAEVEAGRFREDLFYRLDVFPIEIPPLRDRLEDVPALAEHFAARASERLGRLPPPLTEETWAAVETHPWPGNVRELQNAVERALILHRGGPLVLAAPRTRSQAGPEPTGPARLKVLSDAELRALERDNLERALALANGRVSGPKGAAALLGLKASTLASRMRTMGIGRSDAKPGRAEGPR